MLDIQFIRDNPDLVQQKSNQKDVQVDIKQLLDLDIKRRNLLTTVDELRAERNKLSTNLTSKPSANEVAAGVKIKNEITELENNLKIIEEAFHDLIKQVPNVPTDDVPIGKSENENKVIKTWGVKKDFDFKPKTHWELGETRGLIDKERASKVSGSRFVYLKGALVELQFAIIQFVLNTLGNEKILEHIIQEHKLSIVSKPFTPVIPPMMMRTDVYQETGRLKAEETTYKLADDDLWLIASAEHSMCSMYRNEILDEPSLPIRYLGYSTSFRREVGTYGKDTNGIVRMHHFDKLEMEVFSTPETSLEEHYFLVAIQEYLTQQLELPYELILKCTADIGVPNARGVDINMWLPGQAIYKETHTADYMTDYQTRDLKTRFKRDDGTIELLHTNDATAFAINRTMAAIIENYQTKDGHIIIPTVLRPYMSEREEI